MILLFVHAAWAAPIEFSARAGGGLGFVGESSAGRVVGRVDVFTASLDLQAGSGSLVVDPASLNTGLGPRDQHMLVYALDVVNNPELRFDVQAATRADHRAEVEGQWSLTGTLSLHGVALPVTVPVTVSRDGAQLRLQGEVPLNLADFGIPDPSVVIARFAPAVNVTFDLVGADTP